MRSYHSGDGPSQRQLRVGEQLRQIVADLIQRGDFYGSHGTHGVTVTEVQATPDLKSATVFVVGHNDQDIAEQIESLNENARDFQKEISKQATLKFTPRLRFVFDKSFEKANRIDSLLHNISYAEDNPADNE